MLKNQFANLSAKPCVGDPVVLVIYWLASGLAASEIVPPGVGEKALMEAPPEAETNVIELHLSSNSREKLTPIAQHGST